MGVSNALNVLRFRVLSILVGLMLGGGLGGMIWIAHLRLSPSMADRAKAGFVDLYRDVPATTRKLLDAAGYGPNDRLIGAANFDGALVFSNRVMELDRQRGYRFRPGQSNLWVFPRGFPNQILVPDTDEVRSAIDEVGIPVTSQEKINSRGCRGAEWADFKAYDYRVLVVGDSFTEGILVDEDQTFCRRLQWHLESRTDKRVLVVNAGVVGYSTEQEYYAISELAPELHPNLILLCFYANDVHRDHLRVLSNHQPAGDWDAAAKWLGRCKEYCMTNEIRFPIVVIPDQMQLKDRKSRKQYQYRLEQIASELGIHLIDPDERFLSQRDQALYLSEDAHLAPAGHELLAQVLADHIIIWMN